MPVEKGIERVEEFLLRAPLVGKELDVVDEEDVGLPVALPEFDERIVLDGVDELVGERLAGHIHDLGRFALAENGVPDGVHEMGLAQTHASVNEERIVGARGRIGDGLARRLGELIVRSHDKGVETIARVEAAHSGELGLARGHFTKHRLADCGLSLDGRRFVRFVAEDKFQVPGRAQGEEDDTAQKVAEVTLDP